jgi:hypothetical protein
MATPIRIRRSAVPNKKPTTDQLQLGELAVNFYDGKVFLKQDQGDVGVGSRVVEIGAGSASIVGKTIFVSINGDDNNTGLNEQNSKATIKSAVSVALPGDTVKVFPGQYYEDNPITLADNVSIEGTELRRCLVTPRNVGQDLFYFGEGCHITDLSFVGSPSTDGAAVVAYRTLLGTESDRFFDAARLIRQNLDFIAHESVGFLTSGYSGFAGSNREQDAARLLELNTDFIASETIGFITSTSYRNPPFQVVDAGGNPTSPTNCEDDIRDIIEAITLDLKAGSNIQSIGAGRSYYESGSLQHITGTDPNGYSVKQTTIDAINHVVGITTYIINNQTYPKSFTSLTQDTSSYSPVLVSGGCTDTFVKIESLAQIVIDIVDDIDNAAGITSIYGVDYTTKSKCIEDVKYIYQSICHDITRGGNSKCIESAEKYFNSDNTLKDSILKNPEEISQTIGTLEYSKHVARAVINNCLWGGTYEDLAKNVSSADYNNTVGIITITSSTAHDLTKNQPVKLKGLEFTCPGGSGITTTIFPDGTFGDIFPVHNVVGVNTFEVFVGISTIVHTYSTGGTFQKYQTFQNQYGQVRDLSIQIDPLTNYNNVIPSCVNVNSAIFSCVGVVTNILRNTPSIVGTQFNRTYPGNSGQGISSTISVTDASYDRQSGIVRLTVPNLNGKKGDLIELRDLVFSCDSGAGVGTTEQKFPSGQYGYDFYIDKVNANGTYDVSVGLSTLNHTYVSGGFIVDRFIDVSFAQYDNTTGITTINAPGAYVREGDFVTLRDIEFSCPGGSGITTTLFPDGTNGYDFKVLSVSSVGSEFVVNVGVSTIQHTYVGGGKVKPPFSRGTGIIRKGPYVRNCTNFIPNSIGAKIDGFNADEGDQLNDIGVQGSFNVDSYTQFNQGGIGVSVTNGAYCQLVSIFTICDDLAIYAGNGGQLDLTNSNSSFGTRGLVAEGVGDQNSKCVDRYTGEVFGNAIALQNIVTVSGLGNNRPYQGQAIYFDKKYFVVSDIKVTNGGSGYTSPPRVTIDNPTGPGLAIPVQAIASIENGSVTEILVFGGGAQFEVPPTVTIDPPSSGVQATAQSEIEPIYYGVLEATEPSAGITTISLIQNLNNDVGTGTTVYFARQSFQIVSSHSFQYIGAGNTIETAYPSRGGVTIQENEVIKLGGGEITYTSTDQAGNFRIGDGVEINQATGTVSGNIYIKSLFTQVTPFILALGGD